MRWFEAGSEECATVARALNWKSGDRNPNAASATAQLRACEHIT